MDDVLLLDTEVALVGPPRRDRGAGDPLLRFVSVEGRVVARVLGLTDAREIAAPAGAVVQGIGTPAAAVMPRRP